MFSICGRWLAKVPKRRAEELLFRDRRAMVHKVAEGRVVAIQLRSESPSPVGSATPLSPASYGGQRYVHREHLSPGAPPIYKLKDIDEADAHLFGTIADVCTER